MYRKRSMYYEPLFEREYKCDTGYDAISDNVSMDSPTLEYVIWLERKLENKLMDESRLSDL